MLKINMEYKNGILFVRLIGSLDKITTTKLIDSLIPIIIKHGIRYLVYNFNELNNLDDVGYKSLLMAYNAINKNNGKVLVVNNRFDIKEFVEVSNELKALELLKI